MVLDVARTVHILCCAPLSSIRICVNEVEIGDILLNYNKIVGILLKEKVNLYSVSYFPIKLLNPIHKWNIFQG